MDQDMVQDNRALAMDQDRRDQAMDQAMDQDMVQDMVQENRDMDQVPYLTSTAKFL